MMLIALQTSALLTPVNCFRAGSAEVSTVDRRYGAISLGGIAGACGNKRVLLVRSGKIRWSVVAAASESYCNDWHAPRRVIEDLFGTCMRRSVR
jgi:hypothetical protein